MCYGAVEFHSLTRTVRPAKEALEVEYGKSGRDSQVAMYS